VGTETHAGFKTVLVLGRPVAPHTRYFWFQTPHFRLLFLSTLSHTCPIFCSPSSHCSLLDPSHHNPSSLCRTACQANLSWTLDLPFHYTIDIAPPIDPSQSTSSIDLQLHWKIRCRALCLGHRCAHSFFYFFTLSDQSVVLLVCSDLVLSTFSQPHHHFPDHLFFTPKLVFHASCVLWSNLPYPGLFAHPFPHFDIPPS
jgi:hypothetical protein